MFDKKRSKTVAVSLTTAEGTLGSLIGALILCSMRRWPSIIKHKASNSRGLRGAGVYQSVGSALNLSRQHNLMSIGASHNDRKQALSSPISGAARPVVRRIVTSLAHAS